jgi:hypothetical protein
MALSWLCLAITCFTIALIYALSLIMSLTAGVFAGYAAGLGIFKSRIPSELSFHFSPVFGIIDNFSHSATFIADSYIVKNIMCQSHIIANSSVVPTDLNAVLLTEGISYFKPYVVHNTDVMQLRTIAHSGYEIIRVDRLRNAAHSVTTTAIASLQDKHTSGYFTAYAADMTNRDWISDFNLNKGIIARILQYIYYNNNNNNTK